MARSSHYSRQLLVLRWELLVICWLSALALELLFELLFMELLFALELLFIIRPGAPDHGAAGAPLLVLFIIRPGAPDHGAAGCL